MNIKQAAELLNREGKSMLLKSNELQEEVSAFSNYYHLKLNEHKWLYGVWMVERQNNPYIKVEKEFESEEEAAKYLFLKLLSSHYFSKYVGEFMKRHPELAIGEDSFDERGLRQSMSLLKIPSSFLIKDKTQAKNRAIMLNEKGDEQNFLSFVNSNGEIVHSSLPMDNQSALFFAFKGIYMLYLFEKKVSPLLESYDLRDEFTDHDINFFIS